MTTPEDPNQLPAGGQPPSDPSPYGAPPAYGSTPPPPPPAYGSVPPPGQYGGAPAYGGGDYGQTPYGVPGGQAYGGAQLAAWGWRVLGYIIDAVIVAIPSAIIGVATGSRVVYDIIAAILGLTIGYLNGATGQSPGKHAVGIKVLRESDGQLIGGGMGILRTITHILDSLACLIGWFWPLWDDKRQTFADKIIGTVVIKL